MGPNRKEFVVVQIVSDRYNPCWLVWWTIWPAYKSYIHYFSRYSKLVTSLAGASLVLELEYELLRIYIRGHVAQLWFLHSRDWWWQARYFRSCVREGISCLWHSYWIAVLYCGSYLYLSPPWQWRRSGCERGVLPYMCWMHQKQENSKRKVVREICEHLEIV